jgi:clan AA aspartic protease
MTGQITPELDAVVAVTVVGPGGDELELDAALDTGFNGYLTVPPDVALVLGLRQVGARAATLADGSRTQLAAYLVSIRWDGLTRLVVCLAADGGPLIGMRMMHGYRVLLEVIDGGAVTIGPLQAERGAIG